MRFFVWTFSAVLLLASAPFLLAQAQFREPTKEELQMTADPKAPGAAAVYLDSAEIADDSLHFHSVYARIKVLQEKGKELATVEIPYESGSRQVKAIKGRTIHPDGTVSNLATKAEDLLWMKSGDAQIRRKVFTLPNVEVGSILEYYYELAYDDNHFSSPHWDIQKPYFVHQAHYMFTPFQAFLKGSEAKTSMYLVDEHGDSVNSLIYWPLVPAGAQVKQDVRGRYTLDLTDVPAIPREDWMPPINSMLYQVLFYYKSDFNSAEFWSTQGKRWSKEVDDFAEPTEGIRKAVEGLVSSSDSELDKARKLYKAVQALDNTDFSRQKGKAELKALGFKVAKKAEDTWAQKSGSREDIALLYLSMLRAAGLTAYDMKVVNRDRNLFTPGYLSFDQLDDDIVILSTGGKEIFLDPGEKMCPFQLMHWKHSGAGGLRQGPGGLTAMNSPLQPYSSNTLMRIGDVSVDEHGAVTALVRIVMNGQEALYWRQQALTSDLDEMKKRFDRSLEMPEGVEAHIDHFLGLSDPDANLIAVVKGQGTLGVATAKRLMLPGFFFEARGRRPFVDQARRTEAIDMHYAERVTDQVVYHLPPSLAVEGAPKDAKIPWADKAVLDVKVSPSPGGVTVTRSFARGFTLLKAEQYQDLRAFYQKIAENDQQQFVLTQAVERKGN